MGIFDGLEQIWHRAATAGYFHVLLTDSKFARLCDLGDKTKAYMTNVNRVKQIAADFRRCLLNASFDQLDAVDTIPRAELLFRSPSDEDQSVIRQ